MKFNFKWGKNNKQEMTPELTERKVNVYKHENPIKGAEHLGQRKCVECGKWFTPAHHNQTICSDECREKRRHKQKNEWQRKAYVAAREIKKTEQTEEYKQAVAVPTRTCIICGKTFTPKSVNHRVCSDECRKEQMRRVTNKWNAEHREENKRRQHEYYESRKAAKSNKHLEVAVVIRKLIEAGVDDDVVAKYLQTTFTK